MFDDDHLPQETTEDEEAFLRAIHVGGLLLFAVVAWVFF